MAVIYIIAFARPAFALALGIYNISCFAMNGQFSAFGIYVLAVSKHTFVTVLGVFILAISNHSCVFSICHINVNCFKIYFWYRIRNVYISRSKPTFVFSFQNLYILAVSKPAFVFNTHDVHIYISFFKTYFCYSIGDYIY